MQVEDVHKRMDDLIKERNLTPYQLAKQMGVTPSSIYNMKKRGTMPTIETVEKFCQALDISMSDFFTFADKSANTRYVSSDESKLLDNFRAISLHGRERLQAYAEGILATERQKEA